MNSINKLASELKSLVNESDAKKPQPYDTDAKVLRVEGDTLWVHIPGGVDETPIKKTINASVGDNIKVRVAGGSAWASGNSSAPPTDDKRANEAMFIAMDSQEAAQRAKNAADSATEDAARAKAAAESVEGIAEEAREDAQRAEGYATEAKASAENASEYAARALGNLSTVQSVTETLNWITSHGTMTLTSDTALDPTHVYFVVDQNGDYEVGGTHYSVVTEPDVADISTYYELSIDESLNNYVGTHLAVTSEGLWLLPDAGGNKVLIATGQGTTYTDAGTYIVKTENGADVVLARFTSNGSQVGKDGEARILQTFNSFEMKDAEGNSFVHFSDLRDETGRASLIYSFTADGVNTRFYFAPMAENTDYFVEIAGGDPQGLTITKSESYVEFSAPPIRGSIINIMYTSISPACKAYTLGTRDTDNYDFGAYSLVEGQWGRASGYASHAEGVSCRASGHSAHAEGYGTRAEGYYSHSQNYMTKATGDHQTALGILNVEDEDNIYSVIIGNGDVPTEDRSNALAVTWDGNVHIDLSEYRTAHSTDKAIYNALVALGWESEVTE